jgi:hypothetical protein
MHACHSIVNGKVAMLLQQCYNIVRTSRWLRNNGRQMSNLLPNTETASVGIFM